MPNQFRPAKSYHRDIPAVVFAGTDNAEDVAAIMSDHDLGYFQRSAIFWDAIMTDDRCLAVVSKRAAGLPNLPLVIKASDHRAGKKAQMVAELLGGIDGNGGLFGEYVTDDLIKQIVSWRVGGFPVVLQKIYITKTDPWGVRLRLWHPQFVRWDYTEQRYMLITQDGQVGLPREGEDDREWCVIPPAYGFQYGWRRGVVRAICFSFLSRRWNARDWSRYDEVCGIPARLAKYPSAEANKDHTEAFISAVENIGNDPAIAIPQGDGDKANWGYELVEAKALTFQTFQLHRAEINQDIGILVLGENDTTGGAADAGGTGSFASKQVSVGISRDKAKEDAAIGPYLRWGVFRQWAAVNVGDEDLAPQIGWQTEPPEDDAGRATVLLTLGQALQALNAAVGKRIDEDAILERFDVPIIQDQETYMAENPPVDPTPGGEGGDEGGQPGNEKPKDDADGKDDKGGKKPPKKETKALVALRAAQARPAGKLTYAEKVAAKGAELAGEALGGYRAALVGAIRGVKDPKEMQKRIVATFEAHDPRDAAELIRRVRLMSNGGGRITAQEAT